MKLTQNIEINENIITANIKATELGNSTIDAEYSCAVKPHIRAGGNRQSGIQETVIASLLA